MYEMKKETYAKVVGPALTLLVELVPGREEVADDFEATAVGDGSTPLLSVLSGRALPAGELSDGVLGCDICKRIDDIV